MQIAKYWSEALNNVTPSDVTLYGKTGTGTTAAAKFAKEQLNEATTVYANVYKQFYNETCVVSFRSNKIAATGGINIILAALIGAVIGFVVVSIVIYIIDMPKYLRSRDAANREQKSEEEKQ